MPVKKSQSKKGKAKKQSADEKKSVNEKKKQPKKVSKRVQKDIERAIEKIPGILTEHVRFTETDSPPLPPHSSAAKYMKDEQVLAIERQKRRVLWIGVTCLLSIILIMWLWNARVAIYSLVRSPNTVPWGTAKADFSAAMATLEQQDKKLNELLSAVTPTSTAATTSTEEAEEKLKASLLSLIAGSPTSTPTSTSQTTSTTLPIQ